MSNIGKDQSFSELLSRFVEGFHPWIEVDYGWAVLVKECHEKLISIDPDYKLVQVKEKFGGLRFYFNPSIPVYTRKMHDVIADVERRSFSICEICGEVGKLRKTLKTNWYKTLCDKHANKEMYKNADE